MCRLIIFFDFVGVVETLSIARDKRRRQLIQDGGKDDGDDGYAIMQKKSYAWCRAGSPPKRDYARNRRVEAKRGIIRI